MKKTFSTEIHLGLNISYILFLKSYIIEYLIVTKIIKDIFSRIACNQKKMRTFAVGN